MEIIKLAALSLIIMLIAMQYKAVKADIGMYISVAFCLFIMGFLVIKLEPLSEFISGIESVLEGDILYIKILLKLLGIAYICEFASSLCREAGFSAMAGQITVAGKVSMVIIGLPVMNTLLATMKDFF